MKKFVSWYMAIILGLVFPSMVFTYMEGMQKQHINTTVTEMSEEDDCVLLRVKVGDDVINMELEEYVLGVVLKEMPASFELEALKAQAVVARTYAARSLLGSKHSDADICSDPSCCQGYSDPTELINSEISAAELEKVKSAVSDTQSVALYYDGKLIEATYFSCSGGSTEDAVEVWGADIPYLKAVKSPGEEIADHFTDTVRFSLNEFLDALSVVWNGEGRLIGEIEYTTGGGVDTIIIAGISFSGLELRSKLKLRSTAFSVTHLGDSITITTKGYGHRVGMSQYGAEAMALQGYDYHKILMYYYSGVELSNMV